MTTHAIDPARFTTLLLDRGYTHGELAAMLEVHPHRVPRWESGTENVPPGILARLAAIDAAAAAAAAGIVADRARAANTTITAHRDAGERGPADITMTPLTLGPLDDAAFHAAWPEHAGMPARWWWHVAAIAENYGIDIERGSTYSR
ncbi:MULTISPECIES: hypothetical protein [Tomitella]|uniref:Uncharacterized protein n=2 Tax=Tomitella TaxID=741759 RepID=A0A516X8T7_9ACTN|nr:MULTISPECIES: hypothetical protein [Tomitella]QDQ99489.1 hypothetical protein FO059_17980 [Tomitella fengzijianii]